MCTRALAKEQLRTRPLAKDWLKLACFGYVRLKRKSAERNPWVLTRIANKLQFSTSSAASAWTPVCLWAEDHVYTHRCTWKRTQEWFSEQADFSRQEEVAFPML